MTDIMTHQKMTRHPNNRTRLFYVCLLSSLVLHVLMAIGVYYYQPSEIPRTQKETTTVKLVNKPIIKQKEDPLSQKKKDQYELDPLPVPPAKKEADKIEREGREKTVETHRKSDHDQWVEKEQARSGQDNVDETKIPSNLAVSSKLNNTQESNTVSSRPKEESKAINNITPKPDSPEGKHISSPGQKVVVPSPPQSKPTEESPQQPVIPLNNLFPDRQTLNRIAQGKLGYQDLTQKREDIASGDITWLNLQSGPLASFFRRFNNRIEMVWNYPREAIKDKLQGTVELLIIINKEGELIDVLPIKSSGADILDLQAIEAVYAAAPFGPLGKYYQQNTVKIRAHFTYFFIDEAPRRYIYGLKSPFL